MIPAAGPGYRSREQNPSETLDCRLPATASARSLARARATRVRKTVDEARNLVDGAETRRYGVISVLKEFALRRSRARTQALARFHRVPAFVLSGRTVFSTID